MAFLTAREIKLYLMIVALVTLLAVFVTALIILLGGRGDGEGGGRRPERVEAYKPDSATEDPLRTKPILSGRMKVPEDFKALFEAEWKPFRQLQRRWTKPQIEAYWIDPQKIIEEELRKESEKAVSSFFEELP